MFTDVKSLEYKSIWIENDITLPDTPVGKDAHWTFKGKNLTDKPLLIKVTPSCGCTSVDKEPFTVAPNGDFEVKGLYRAVNVPEKFSRRVSVWFGETRTDNQDEKVSVIFRGSIV